MARPKLEYGSHGQAVVEAQSKLNQMLPDTLPPLALDGVYGTQTIKRMKQFQASRGLAVDGVVGPKTWAALDGVTPTPGGPPAAPPPPTPQKSNRVRVGATLICACGTKTSKLRFPFHDRVLATVLDWYPYANVGPFGKCTSLHNPAVQMHTQMNNGVFSPQTCQPAILGPWTPGHPIEKAGTPPAATLDGSSVLVCGYGGFVSILK